MNRAYLRYELLRTVRNRRVFILALAFPLVLFYVIAAPQRSDHDLAGTGLSAPLYFMASVSSFGTMTAMLSIGGRIATERAAGWNRQLRITPLSSRDYFRAKFATTYVVAISSVLLIYAAGITMGVSLPASRWWGMFIHVLIALVPFAALGVLLGHLMTPDSVGPVVGGLTALLAILGGTWFPIGAHGFIHVLAVELPSYYVVQAGRIGIGAPAWGAHGWIVLVAWTAILAALARRAYLRDTGRV